MAHTPTHHIDLTEMEHSAWQRYLGAGSSVRRLPWVMIDLHCLPLTFLQASLLLNPGHQTPGLPLRTLCMPSPLYGHFACESTRHTLTPGHPVNLEIHMPRPAPCTPSLQSLLMSWSALTPGDAIPCMPSWVHSMDTQTAAGSTVSTTVHVTQPASQPPGPLAAPFHMDAQSAGSTPWTPKQPQDQLSAPMSMSHSLPVSLQVHLPHPAQCMPTPPHGHPNNRSVNCLHACRGHTAC